ncbi:MAG: VWA domain-containing protein, partial [Bryobacteraceae bacterium]
MKKVWPLMKADERGSGKQCLICVYLRSSAAIIAFFLLAFAAPAQDVAKFSTRRDLVIVDVTVRDKAGKPIDGLTQKDFAVFEDGKQQQITVFEYQKLAMDPEPPPTLALSDQLKLPEAPRTVITAEKPGEITYHDKRLLVFFLDFSSMGIPEQLRAQDASLEYLDKHITKDDMVAILLYTSQIQIKTDFTADREVLTQIIKDLPIGEMS